MYIHVSYWSENYIRIYKEVLKVPEDISWCIDWDTFDELFKQKANRYSYFRMTYYLYPSPDLN